MDVIVIGAGDQVTVPAGKEPVTFQGELGVISLRSDAVEHAYALGEGGWTRGEYHLASTASRSAPLRAVEVETLVLDPGSTTPPETGDVVRVITADGWVYPYSVVAAEARSDALRLRVGEGPGFVFDSATRRLRLTSFPQREHSGAARVEWSPRAVR